MAKRPYSISFRDKTTNGLRSVRFYRTPRSSGELVTVSFPKEITTLDEAKRYCQEQEQKGLLIPIPKMTFGDLARYLFPDTSGVHSKGTPIPNDEVDDNRLIFQRYLKDYWEDVHIGSSHRKAKDKQPRRYLSADVLLAWHNQLAEDTDKHECAKALANQVIAIMISFLKRENQCNLDLEVSNNHYKSNLDRSSFTDSEFRELFCLKNQKTIWEEDGFSYVMGLLFSCVPIVLKPERVDDDIHIEIATGNRIEIISDIVAKYNRLYQQSKVCDLLKDNYLSINYPPIALGGKMVININKQEYSFAFEKALINIGYSKREIAIRRNNGAFYCSHADFYELAKEGDNEGLVEKQGIFLRMITASIS